MGGIGGLVGMILPGIFHDGGPVGSATSSRAVPASLFNSADRYHDGGAVGLKSDEVPAILQTGEYVLPRGSWRAGAGGSDSAGGAGQVINAPQYITINTPDADSFRRSEKQISSQLARRGQAALGANG
ncbi:MAG: hypothetical protein QM656_02110 [Paracoccaceae bacterium]